jgi:hypothetical protein
MPAQNEALKLHHDLAITIKSLRDELTQTQAELTQKSDELRMRKEQASLQLAQLYASRSWRLTRPLRAVGRRLRRWRQASSAAGRPATG